MTLAFNAIRQVTMNGTDPLVLEIATEEANHTYPAKWWLDWATATPEKPWHLYFVGDVLIGFIFEEVADFNTLSEFVAAYEAMGDLLWRQYQYETDDWLWQQCLARVVDVTA
jgi:hypothetical protein